MLTLYFHLMSAQIKGQMSYKKSFLIEIFGYLILNIIDLLAIYFLFLKFPNIKGWSMGEIFFLYGIASFSFAIAQIFGESLEKVPELVRTGEFDQILTRPVSPILQIMPMSFRFSRCGRVIEGLIAIFLAYYILHFKITFLKIIIFLISIISSVIVYFGIFMIGAAYCFWTIQSAEVMNAFTYGGVELSKFPITIYRNWMKTIFLYIIPIGFVSYYPSLIFLNKNNTSIIFALICPFIAITFYILAWIFWRVGINHYQSTGS